MENIINANKLLFGSGLSLDSKGFKQLLDNQSLVDCTLCCNGGKISAHKIVLSACSSYLAKILSDHPVEHPIIILPELNIEDIRTLIHYMYTGELLKSNQLNSTSLLRTAAILSVNSLNDLLTPLNGNNNNNNQQQQTISLSPQADTLAATAAAAAAAAAAALNPLDYFAANLNTATFGAAHKSLGQNPLVAGLSNLLGQQQQQQQQQLLSSASLSQQSLDQQASQYFNQINQLLNNSTTSSTSSGISNISNCSSSSSLLSSSLLSLSSSTASSLSSSSSASSASSNSSSSSSLSTSSSSLESSLSSANSLLFGAGQGNLDNLANNNNTNNQQQQQSIKVQTLGKSTNEFQFKCPVCHNDFQTICSFEYHMQRTHNVTSFGCEICQKPFASLRYVLTDHMRRCHGIKSATTTTTTTASTTTSTATAASTNVGSATAVSSGPATTTVSSVTNNHQLSNHHVHQASSRNQQDNSTHVGLRKLQC